MAFGVPPFCIYWLMVAWHASWPHFIPRSAEGFSVPMKLFSFPTFFEAPLFKPHFFFFSLLHFPSALTPLISQLLPHLLLWFLSFSYFSSTPLSFYSFFLLKFYLLPFLVLSSLLELHFPFTWWWIILILGALPPPLPSFLLVWVRL